MNDKERKPWVTASDVAARAGVSRSAVSRAFSPTASIAPQTRERVMAAARALGYQVNLIARDMITQRSSMIGVVTAGFENPFRARLLSDLMAALGQHALTPLVTNAEDPRQVRQSLEQLLSYRIAGLVMTSASPPLSVAQQYLEHRIPVVMINREANLPGADVVVSDNAAGAAHAAQRLVRAGARRLAFVGPRGTSYSARSRAAAFEQAIGPRDAFDATLVRMLDTPSDTHASGVDAARHLFATGERPDGVFCSSDLLALGVIDVARREFGLRVPDDLRVIGFDDIPAAEYDAYRLTTLRQDTRGLALAAIDLLADRMQTFDGPSRTRVVPVTQAVRNSCA
ncbi:LacI family DNA-binding transcriptional regulator [Burkholderia sp. AU42008]|uniref:LacI family DNA-binding transcriptional regulator n=1 Tax=unclassified Burkholderia TaxID=2613784 RepID=UPI000B7AE5CF|nr:MULTISPECIES: LacI family DNA-binding transcriptional regulator [unclassified Burkholderia]MBR8232717.1 LacI family DNA-binding transcriptional regulator [Burkholderia sp. AU32357]MBY4873046.1 LacI family DNA-binding transcriptional regulator [Burkholderia sp. AU42008]OXI41112.1 LacI family transcriptional regulator [Burkholderia sp. AU17457]